MCPRISIIDLASIRSSSRGHAQARPYLDKQHCCRETFFSAPNSILEIRRRPVAHWNRLGESYRAMGPVLFPTPLLHAQKHANMSKNRPRGVSRLSMKMVVFGPKMVDSGGK